MDILIYNNPMQLTTAHGILVRQYVTGGVLQATSAACIVDLTPPTFSGIQSLTAQTKGQVRVSWDAGSDVSLPIRYEVYVQEATATNLFNAYNVVAITTKLQYDVFTSPDGTPLKSGMTYYFGVKAVDAVGNRDFNIASMSIISTGIVGGQIAYEPNGAFSIGKDGKLYGTLWITKDSVIGSGPLLGTGGYEIYDKSGALILSQSGIVADSSGKFTITPVNSTLSTTLDHYIVKVMIFMDYNLRSGYVSLIEPIPEYEVHGSFAVDTSDQLVATFWATADEELVTTPARLGTASYTVYDRNGNTVGMSESGIAPDSNGLFKITPISSTLTDDKTFYSVKVSVLVDNIARTNFLPIFGSTPEYEVHGSFAVNASANLIASFWATASDQLITSSSRLGTASYEIYDHNGVSTGLTESGITHDSNGLFKITPVVSTLTSDLTFYSAKITIVVDGVSKINIIPLFIKSPDYEAKGQFSINAMNQFQATFWATMDGVVKSGSALGAASYTVYDKDGVAVSGLTQSGMVADVNGRFTSTPVSAASLTDLTHYSVKIAIIIDGVERISYRGFTLLGS